MIAEDKRGIKDSQRTLVSIAILAVAVPLVSLPLGIDVGTQKLLALAFGAGLVLASEALHLCRSKNETLAVPWTLCAMPPLLAAGLISLSHAASRRHVLLSLGAIALAILLVLVVVRRVRSHRAIRGILWALLCTGVVSSIVALVQYVGWIGDPNDSAVGRMISTFGNRNFLGGFLGYITFPTIALYLRSQTRRAHVLVGVGLVLCTGTILLVQQTGIVIALAVGALFLTLGMAIFRLGRAAWNVRVPLVVLLVPLLATVSAGLCLWSLQPHRQPPEASGSIAADLWAANSGIVREVDWWTAWEMVRAHPWTGVGLGNYKVTFLTFKAQFLETPRGQQVFVTVPRAEQAHNEYVQVLAELGLPGAVTLAVVLLVSAVALWKRLAAKIAADRRLELLFVTSGLVVAIAHATVSFPFHLPASSLTVAILLGLSMSVYYGADSTILVRLRRGGTRAAAVVLAIIALTCLVGAIREVLAQVALARGETGIAQGSYRAAQAELERSFSLGLCPTRVRFLLAYAYLAEIDSQPAAQDVGASAAMLHDAHRVAMDTLTVWHTEQAVLLAASTALRLEDLETAARFAADVLRTRPVQRYERNALYLLASVTLASGDETGAEAKLRRVIDAFPDHAPASILLARILAASHRTSEALGILGTAIWAVSQSVERIDREITTADLGDAEELAWERRGLLLGRDALVREYEALNSR